MGRIINSGNLLIRPTEDDIRYSSLKKLLPYFTKRLRELDPPPLRFYTGLSLDGHCYLALDGHHKLILAELFSVTIDVFVADHMMDEITFNDVPHIATSKYVKSNESIELRWDYAIKQASELAKLGIVTIRDLRMKYDFLRSRETLEEYLRPYQGKA